MYFIEHVYAMDENKKLYKLYASEVYKRDDSPYECSRIHIANGTFILELYCEHEYNISGQVACWPLPAPFEVFVDYLNGDYIQSVHRLLIANNIDPLKIKIIGFLVLCKLITTEEESGVIANTFTANGREYYEESYSPLLNSFFEDGKEITKKEAKKIYQHFFSSDQPT